MRSATSKTSGMLWLMRTTARPCSRTRAMRSSTLRGLHDAERGGRLVHEDDLAWPSRPRGDRDALALAAGHGRRPARRDVLQRDAEAP